MSELVARLRESLREDMDEAAANPGREAAETVILGLVGLGWLARTLVHLFAYLGAFAERDPHPLDVDYGLRASCVPADARERWWLGTASCLVAVVLGLGLSSSLALWSQGPAIGVMIVANWLVPVADPVLVQLLPAD